MLHGLVHFLEVEMQYLLQVCDVSTLNLFYVCKLVEFGWTLML